MIYYILAGTFTGEWGIIFVSAVASQLCGVIVVFVDQFVVVRFCEFLHIVHATIADFQSVSVTYFVKWMSSREMLYDEADELFANIGFNTGTVGLRRIEPCNIAASSFLLCLILRISCVGLKIEFIFVSSCMQYIFILSFSFVEYGFVTGDGRQAALYGLRDCFYYMWWVVRLRIHIE